MRGVYRRELIIPSLDAIIFFHPKQSQIDIVQSVGRVMRKAEGKKMGYVILPVGIPAGVEPEEALNDNTRYRVVWQTLNALRSHDDRFEAIINQASLGQDISDKIEIIIGSDEVGEGFGGEDRGEAIRVEFAVFGGDYGEDSGEVRDAILLGGLGGGRSGDCADASDAIVWDSEGSEWGGVWGV